MKIVKTLLLFTLVVGTGPLSSGAVNPSTGIGSSPAGGGFTWGVGVGGNCSDVVDLIRRNWMDVKPVISPEVESHATAISGVLLRFAVLHPGRASEGGLHAERSEVLRPQRARDSAATTELQEVRHDVGDFSVSRVAVRRHRTMRGIAPAPM